MDLAKMNQLKEDALQFGVELNEKQLFQFYRYYELLIDWNEKINLTAITEFEEVLKKHFLDSISIGRIMKQGDSVSVLDIGTGAGFPIKIAFPDTKVTLLDSLNKRVNFLNHVIQELELDNIFALHGRAEDFAKKKEMREQFDLCVSRAVANLSSLSEFCLPYVKLGGSFISYKSEKAMEELEFCANAISILGGGNVKTDEFFLSGTDFKRTFIMIEKIKETPLKYPRKAGTPIKYPL